jgi:hypothetical protein
MALMNALSHKARWHKHFSSQARFMNFRNVLNLRDFQRRIGAKKIRHARAI